MKQFIKIIGLMVSFFTFVMVLVFLFVIMNDRIEFIRCVNNGYSTPWYSNSVLKAPYTHFMLSQIKPTYHLTTNGIGDIWVVKETKVGDKTFWTVDYTISVLNLNEEKTYEKK